MDNTFANETNLTRSQVARLFGVSPHTITRWAKEGRLPSITTLGGQRRYSKNLVYQLLQQMASGSSSSEAQIT